VNDTFFENTRNVSVLGLAASAPGASASMAVSARATMPPWVRGFMP
jgi:hypothetical protein